jgi:ribosomal protein L12E/L44/L45/RPP1/RPP2
MWVNPGTRSSSSTTSRLGSCPRPQEGGEEEGGEEGATKKEEPKKEEPKKEEPEEDIGMGDLFG